MLDALEDRLLGLVQRPPYVDTIELCPSAYSRSEHDRMMGSGVHALALTDGDGATLPTDELLPECFADAADAPDCSPQDLLGVFFDLGPLGGRLNVADCTTVTLAQRRYFLSAGDEQRGSMSVFLRREELEEAGQLAGRPGPWRSGGWEAFVDEGRAGGGALARSTTEGLRLFGISEAAVQSVALLQSRCLQRRAYHSELQARRAGPGAPASDEALPQPCAAFLLGEAAGAVDHGPGRGVNTAFKGAISLVDQLVAVRQGLATGWQPQPVSILAEHTRAMILIQAQEAKAHIRRFATHLRSAAGGNGTITSGIAATEAEDRAAFLAAVRASSRRLARAGGLPPARRAELSEAEDLCTRLAGSGGLSPASARAIRASGIWAAEEFSSEASTARLPWQGAGEASSTGSKAEVAATGELAGEAEEAVKLVYNRGVKLLKGNGTEKDAAAAAAFAEAARRDHREAQYALGVMLLNGQGVKRDERQAASWFEKAAQKGHAKAQYNLGVMCQHGVGVERDAARASAWTGLAAEQGHRKALRSSNIICFGAGPWMDYDHEEMGVDGILREAEGGNVHAQFRMGVMLYEGDGVDQDRAKASGWFMRAAQRGLSQAQYEMSRMLFLGDGVEQDIEYGLRFLRMAAEQGHPVAQHNLGVKLYFGEGVGVDRSKAAYWFLQAASQDYPEAQNNIGWMLYLGDGVAQNTMEGRRWMLEAASRGNMEAQRHLTSIQGHIVA